MIVLLGVGVAFAAAVTIEALTRIMESVTVGRVRRG